MRDPEEFDAFYKSARDRLLVQTYALTGDLSAARAAVRDTFVAAWHHWRKVSRLEDPEAWARPRAWAHAQRRHTARLWHRDRSLGPELRATLDALGKLSPVQRRTLLLTQLATITLAEMAREVGLPQPEAERELQTATSRFAMHRDVPTTSLRALFEPLRAYSGTVRWPRATIIRRAGTARRRTHTLVGVVASVAAVLGAGVLVTDTTGLHPSLDRERVTADAPLRDTGATRMSADPATLPVDAMLTKREVAEHAGGHAWTQRATSDNTAGDGLVLPCQQERYADPHGVAALVRTFRGPSGSGHGPGAAKAGGRGSAFGAFQVTEVSRSAAAAGRAYRRALGWYAGCDEPRAQLVATQRVTGVGDEAALVALRLWHDAAATLLVGVARTGRVTTTTLTRVPGTGALPLDRTAELLAGAVDDLCVLPDGGACSSRPRHRATAPVPVGEVPGMLVEVDLPPVTGVSRPWVGTQPRRADTNLAATGCDQTDFSAAGITGNLTRSFLVPGSDLPDTFGLTETVGQLPPGRAHALVQQVRNKMAACPQKDLGTEVHKVAETSAPDTDLSVWQVTTEISDHDSVRFWMGIARDHGHVAQIGFVPAGKVTMAPGAFPALVRRALERLPALPPSA